MAAPQRRSRALLTRLGLAGFGVVVGILCLEAGLQITSLVVRAPSEVEPLRDTTPGASRTVRVLCLGESTTHGFGETPYPALLQAALDEAPWGIRFDVINAGLPGAQSHYLADQIEKLVAEHRPDLVIAMMGINDEVYFVDVESLSEPPVWQVLLLKTRVYKLLRLLAASFGRTAEPETGGVLARKHLHTYRQRYARAQTAWSGGRQAEAVEELRALLSTAEEAGHVAPDGGYTIPGPYWHIYEIAHRLISEWLVSQERSAEAVALLRQAIERHPRNPRFRRRLVWLFEQSGDSVGAERERATVAQLEREGALRVTAASWRRLHEALARQGIPLVAVQYPLRDAGVLARLLGEPSDVTIVENVDNFRQALATYRFEEIFIDRFAGDFGHGTELGNRLIADRLMEAVFEPRFHQPGSIINQRAGPPSRRPPSTRNLP